MDKLRRSHEQKMIRGGWHWNRRSREDVLPKDILNEPNRMDEVAYFRAFEKATEEEVKAFVEWTAGKKNKEIFDAAKSLTINTPAPEKVKKEKK